MTWDDFLGQQRKQALRVRLQQIAQIGGIELTARRQFVHVPAQTDAKSKFVIGKFFDDHPEFLNR